jgi:Ca2+-binding RTX toxin-like protein
MYGGEGNDAIFGGVSNDTILGGAGNDTVFGGRGDDLIYGNLGTDVLFGGEGNDYLFSTDQVSPDHLFGGAGNDTFDFRIQGGKTDLTADHVGDFTRAVGGADMVAVSVTGPMVYAEIAAASVTTVEQAIAAANPAIVDGANVVFVAGGADGYLVVDADGTGGLESTQDKVIVLDDFNNALLADPTMIIPIPQ